MNAVQQRWANKYGMNGDQFRKLLRLVEHFARLEERATGEDNPALPPAIETAGKAIEEFCKPLGIAVSFMEGIYPMFKKAGYNEVIPHND
jgi:hypothetical protein